MKENVLIISDSGGIVCGVKHKLFTQVSIPDGVGIIEYEAFKNCSLLQHVDIPKSLILIEACAFEGCISLRSIDIHKVYCLGAEAFAGCKTLTSIDIGSVQRIMRYAFLNCTSLKRFDFPDNVEEIFEGAFENCSSLEKIIFPNGTWKIEDKMFKGCASLKSIDIPVSITSIGSEAFEGCTSLKSIDLPPNLNFIGHHTFNNTSIEELSIPKNVSYIGSIGDFPLKRITVSEDNKYFVSRGGALVGENPTLLTGKFDTIYKYPPLNDQSSFTIEDGITRILGGAFNNCKKLKYLHISSKNLGDLIVDEGVFDDEFFYKCTLFIPPGTRWDCKHHPVFGKFQSIEIE